jgi:hypothetical protein
MRRSEESKNGRKTVAPSRLWRLVPQDPTGEGEHGRSEGWNSLRRTRAGGTALRAARSDAGCKPAPPPALLRDPPIFASSILRIFVLTIGAFQLDSERSLQTGQPVGDRRHCLTLGWTRTAPDPTGGSAPHGPRPVSFVSGLPRLLCLRLPERLNAFAVETQSSHCSARRADQESPRRSRPHRA